MPSPVLLAAHMNDPWMPTTGSGIKGHFYQEGERQTELPPDWYSILSRLGVTMLQVDSEHHTTNETTPGVWDWAAYDRLFETIRNSVVFPPPLGPTMPMRARSTISSEMSEKMSDSA